MCVWQVLVNGMRVRIKLDQDRLAELLGGMDSASIPGLLSHLGDVACLSFAPFHNGEPSPRQCCRPCWCAWCRRPHAVSMSSCRAARACCHNCRAM